MSEEVDRGIPFTKMTGSGNDFVVIDNRDGLLADETISPFTRAVWRRGLGLGADGVIMIERPSRPEVDFRWRYVNADGSVGEMCGNGAMCVPTCWMGETAQVSRSGCPMANGRATT